jgi:DinB superfamily
MNIAEQLHKNKFVFQSLLEDVQPELVTWRPRPDKWCLLEIVCHLYDEEQFDFRFRAQWILKQTDTQPPPFNPIDWVTDNKYMEQNYEDMVKRFLSERDASIVWFKELKNPNWDYGYIHPKLGKVTAKHYLDNWLAHDYLHVRQIIKQKFDFLTSQTNENLEYAGIW